MVTFGLLAYKPRDEERFVCCFFFLNNYLFLKVEASLCIYFFKNPVGSPAGHRTSLSYC